MARVYIWSAARVDWGAMRTAWENALERAGIDDFRFHDLRHTAATYMVMRGPVFAGGRRNPRAQDI